MTTKQSIKLAASARIMHQEALDRKIDCTLFGDGQTILMKKENSFWYTRGSRSSAQSSVGRTIADSKLLTKKVLNHFQLPTAKFKLVSNAEEIKSLNELSFPLVMKPVTGAHGRDVVVGIKDLDMAKTEFSKHNSKMLFEETLSGIEFRIVCIDFKFVAAAHRKPAHVVGDGKQTIQELIDEKNKHPWREPGHSGNLSTIQVDELVLKILEEQGLSLDSIPNNQQEVFLRKTSNLSTGGEASNVTNDVCDENKRFFESISRSCDLNTIGIDIMCQNLNTPITDQENAGVIEVNASPGLRMHHFPLQGEPINVAGKILDMVEPQK